MAQKPGHLVPVPEGALLQDTLTQRCPSAHPRGEDEPHLGPGLPQLERAGPTLWPGHYSSLGQMDRGGSGKTLGAAATWAGTAAPPLPSPAPRPTRVQHLSSERGLSGGPGASLHFHSHEGYPIR